MQDDNVITINKLIDLGIAKAGSKIKLCKESGVNSATLWRIQNGKLKGKPWASTYGKLAVYVLRDGKP